MKKRRPKIKIFKNLDEQERADTRFWRSKTPNEKMKLYEEAFNNYYYLQYGEKPRLQRVIAITKRKKS